MTADRMTADRIRQERHSESPPIDSSGAARRAPSDPMRRPIATVSLGLAGCATIAAIACDLSSSTTVIGAQLLPPLIAVMATSAGTVGADSDLTEISIQAGVPASTHCQTELDYNNCYYYIIAAIGPTGPVPAPTITGSPPDTQYWAFTAPGWSIERGAFWTSPKGSAIAQMSGSVTQTKHGTADTVQVLWWAWPDSEVGLAADSEQLVPTVNARFQAAQPIELACPIGIGAGVCNPLIPRMEPRAERRNRRP